MEPFDHTTVTRLLQELQQGNRSVFNELFNRIYSELKQRAHQQRAKWHRDYTLNTTALVNEAYLKLVDQTQVGWNGRAHFLGVASKAMRHILIDYARKRTAEKRGGDEPALSLEDLGVLPGGMLEFTEERAGALIDLEEALQRLEAQDERAARVVECKFFGGMTIEETAEALGVSTPTVKRD